MPGTRDRRRIPARGDLLPAFVAVGRRFVWAYSICPYEGHGHKNAGYLEMDTRHYTSPISFSGSSRRKSRVRICSAGRRGQNRGCEFAQRVVAAKIGCLFFVSGSSRRKSGACFCSAARRDQNRVPVFRQRIVAAKIGCLFFVSGSSRPKSGGTFDGAYAVAPLQAAGSTINHCKGEPLLPERDLPHCP